jgi:hypothetical protein
LYRKGFKKRGKIYFMISIKIKGRESKNHLSILQKKKRLYLEASKNKKMR